MRQIAEPYIRGKAIRHFRKRSNRYFLLVEQEVLTSQLILLPHYEQQKSTLMPFLMGKNGVDGVYSADPNKVKDATKFDHLTHMDIIEKNLHVMDTTASSLSMDNHIPLVVFNLNTSGNIMKVVTGQEVGTTIEGD